MVELMERTEMQVLGDKKDMEPRTTPVMLLGMAETRHVMVEMLRDMEMRRQHTEGQRMLDRFGEVVRTLRMRRHLEMLRRMVKAMEERQDQEGSDEVMNSMEHDASRKARKEPVVTNAWEIAPDAA